MPRQALASAPERIKMARAVQITGETERTLQAAAAAGLIPGAAKPCKCWTFDEARLRAHFNKPPPVATIHQLNNLGSRGLTREEAVAHLGLSAEDFDLYLQLGRIPQPLVMDDRIVWPIQHLVLRKRRPRGAREGYAGVYVVGFDRFVKIGMSADVSQRLTAIQDWLPLKIKVHQIFIGEGRKCEIALHQRFSQYRLRGEWFRSEGLLVAWINGGCE
jgi:hypothetical protein